MNESEQESDEEQNDSGLPEMNPLPPLHPVTELAHELELAEERAEGHLDPLDRLELATYRIEQRQRYQDQNRTGLLLVHAVMGIFIGIVQQFDQRAAAVTVALVRVEESFHIPFGVSMLIYETLPFVGGVILLVGITAGRKLAIEALGMSLMLLWDALMAATFISGIVWYFQGTFAILQLYPIAVYAGLGMLMGIHLWTLTTLLRRGGNEVRRGNN